MEAVGKAPHLMPIDQRKHVATLVRDLGQRLRRYIRARVRNDDDADDVLQDVWQRLITALDAGPVEQVGAWLYTVARNRIIDRYRRPKMDSLDALADSDEDDTTFRAPDFLLRDDHTPVSEQRRNLFYAALGEALAELPQEQRQVFIWHEFEALSFQQIAALTGENLNTLLARKRYAVLHLRRRLAPLRDEFLP